MVKISQKFSSLEPVDRFSRELGLKHQWLKYYNVYINHDPVMTMTQFMARSTWVANAFEWK